jgi:fumarate reductase subunit D
MWSSLQIVICLFVLFLLAIMLSVLLRFTASDYSFWYLQTFTRILVGNTFVLILCYPIYHIYWNVHYNFWEIKMRLSSCFFEKCRAEISFPYSIFRREFLLPRLLIFCIFMYALLVYRQNKTGILISCWKEAYEEYSSVI